MKDVLAWFSRLLESHYVPKYLVPLYVSEVGSVAAAENDDTSGAVVVPQVFVAFGPFAALEVLKTVLSAFGLWTALKLVMWGMIVLMSGMAGEVEKKSDRRWSSLSSSDESGCGQQETVLHGIEVLEDAGGRRCRVVVPSVGTVKQKTFSASSSSSSSTAEDRGNGASVREWLSRHSSSELLATAAHNLIVGCSALAVSAYAAAATTVRDGSVIASVSDSGTSCSSHIRHNSLQFVLLWIFSFEVAYDLLDTIVMFFTNFQPDLLIHHILSPMCITISAWLGYFDMRLLCHLCAAIELSGGALALGRVFLRTSLGRQFAVCVWNVIFTILVLGRLVLAGIDTLIVTVQLVRRSPTASVDSAAPMTSAESLFLHSCLGLMSLNVFHACLLWQRLNNRRAAPSRIKRTTPALLCLCG